MLATIAATSAACSSELAPAPPAPPTPAERLLEASEVGALVDARASAFTRQVALMTREITDDELERLVPAVRSGFAPELLRRDIAAFLEREAPPGRIDEVLSWLEGGASAEVSRIVDGYEPELSLEEWLGEYTTTPPSEERVRRVARWSDARGTGDFFVLLEQALGEAAFSVRRQLRPEAPPFRRLDDDGLFERLEASRRAAILSTLHASETVPDSILDGSIREYRSESGRWYVETYQLAVAEAMRAAGARVADALAG